jgi:regulator of sirC expression with transglutaminase-like and TPR domain
MAVVEDPRAAFAAELEKPDDSIELGRLCLLIAAEEYPGLDVDGYLARIDAIADGVRPRLTGDEGPASVLAAINRHLYGELGFVGNKDDYYDPRNSYLNEVLERRTGLPILLCILYREVAARLGHQLVGINLPLHFVLAWPLPDGPLIVDAFENGAILTTADCELRLARSFGRPVQLGPDAYEPVGPRMVVRRVLNNLLNEYVRRSDYARSLAVVDRMLIALPIAEDLRHRGLLLFRLGRHREAEEALTNFLANAPEAADRKEIEQHLRWIRRLRASVN